MTALPSRFVWIRGYYGGPPQPELWPADAPSGSIRKDRVLASHPLPAMASGFSLADLASMFPAPKVQEPSDG